MRPSADDRTDLELALLRRGVDERAGDFERCGRCRRTPLIGERIYIYAKDSVRCELCRARERGEPLASQLVHGPEFGHSIKLADSPVA